MISRVPAFFIMSLNNVKLHNNHNKFSKWNVIDQMWTPMIRSTIIADSTLTNSLQLYNGLIEKRKNFDEEFYSEPIIVYIMYIKKILFFLRLHLKFECLILIYIQEVYSDVITYFLFSIKKITLFNKNL